MGQDALTPESLADRGRRRPRTFRRILFVVIVAGLAWAAFRLPIPIFYAYLPGPVRDVEPLIEVSGEQTYSSEGAFYLTTVSVDTEVTFVDWIIAVADPDSIIIMKQDLVPEGTSLEELEKQQREQMTDSKRHAEEVVFSALGLASPTGEGARVVQTVPGYPAAGVLEKDDVIVRVNGERVRTTCEVGSAIDDSELGGDVEVTVRRDGQLQSFVLETAANPQDPSTPFIGVHMADVGYSFDPPAEVEIATGNIAGPSAGLMFSLALYDLLTPDDLTDGLKIAGTGTIACDGGVGPIGGIAQKVAGAENEGAEIFLAPAGNFEEASGAAGDIEVVSISTFKDALEYLESRLEG
jgi:PDZ domain-containing protein